MHTLLTSFIDRSVTKVASKIDICFDAIPMKHFERPSPYWKLKCYKQ